MALRVVSILALAVAITAAAGDAWAQDKAAARKHLREGDRAFKKAERLAGRDKLDDARAEYEAALAAYQAAYEALPNPRIYFPIAMTEERLERWLEALAHYQQILDETDDLDDEFRAQVEVRMEAVKQNLAVVEFDVQPEGATIRIDGEEIGTAPLSDGVPLAPGDYTVEVTADGYQPYETQVTLAAGETPMQMVVLEEIHVEPEEPVAVVEPEPEPEPIGPDRTKLYVGASVTGGLALIATFSGVIALSRHGDFEDESLPADERESARDSGETWALVSDVMWVGAIAAGAYTAYYYYTDYRAEKAAAERRAERGQAVRLMPYATPDGAGVALGGRF